MNFRFFSTAAVLTFLICSCSDSDEYYLLFKESGKTGIVDYKGKIVLENEFRGSLRPFQSGQALYQTRNTNYFINKKGRESTDGFAQATEFNNGYAFVVNPGERISVINDKYKVRRQLDYEEASGFVGKVAVVKKDSRYGAINSSFKEIIPCVYDVAAVARNGEMIMAYADNKIILFDTKGRKILETQETIFEPSEGLIPYYDDGCGFLDMTGRKVIRARREWDCVTPFTNGYSSYLEDGRWGVIDKEGKKVIRAKYYYPLVFNDEGIAVTAMLEGAETKGRRGQQLRFLFGHINANDEEVIPFKYKSALPFHKGKAFVNDGKYWFVIDEENKQYGRAEFQHISADVNTLYLINSISRILNLRSDPRHFGYLETGDYAFFGFETRPVRVRRQN